MPFELSQPARLKALERTKEPQIVLEIDGVTTVYGAIPVKRYLRYGDPGVTFGSGYKYGGLIEVEDSESLISLGGEGGGSSTEIRQSLDPDKGRGSTVSSMSIVLIDKNKKATKLISPGEIVTDILGRRCKLWLGFKDTSFKEDFIPIHRGIIDDVNSKAGAIVLTIANAEQKKRQDLFQRATTDLNGAINNSQTTIALSSTTNFLSPGLGPNGSNDPTLKFYVRIEDEIIRYTGISGNDLTGCVRAQLGSAANSHDNEAGVNTFYRLSGNVIDVILKIYMSGWNGNYQAALDVKHIGYLSPTQPLDNAIFFEGKNIELDYGVVVGDYCTISGSSFGGNNTTATISEVVKEDNGSYVIFDLPLTSEIDSPATVAFRSKYDTLGLNAGLKLHPDEVDIAQHEYLKDLFLSSFEIDIYVKDTIPAKEWIEQYLLAPCGGYSIPRKARVSMGMTVGPIPSLDTKILDDTNVKNPSQIAIRRTISKYFYNTITYRYDEDSLDDKFLSGFIDTDATSRNNIQVGTRNLVIDAKGVRTALSGANLASVATFRRLNRYKFAAEFLEQMRVHFGTGFNVDVGDIVILDGTNLKIADIKNASREFEPRFFEVINKITNIKTGDISFQLLDTGFSTANRYGLIGPSSKIKAGNSATQFVVEPDGFFSVYGVNEGQKWKKLKSMAVIIRSPDYSVSDTSIILKVTSNTITLAAPLNFTPVSGYIMELDVYNSATVNTKLLYGHMRDTDPFDDFKNRYLML